VVQGDATSQELAGRAVTLVTMQDAAPVAEPAYRAGIAAFMEVEDSAAQIGQEAA
jgi:hypothetical protein